jgi:SMI1-KNR4 cell-wall
MKYTTNAIAPPSRQYILQSQRNLNVIYPIDYLAFLTQDNGGVPINRCFDTAQNAKVIDRFLPQMDDPNSDDNGYYDVGVVRSQIFDRLSDDPDQIGAKLVPIVALEFGDMVCLDFRKSPKAPTIVVWDHEQSEEFKPVTEKVADSFTEFLSKLRPLEPYKGAIPE